MTAERRPDRTIDELREQLRALGYLDARVDRFVLGAAAGSDRPARLAIAASLRIGAMAGVLLGPAAALGLRLRAPGLVTSTTDALVAAGYLALLFGLATAVVAAIAILIGIGIARRAADRPQFPRTASRAAAVAGLVVTAVCLVYLTLWWRTASAVDGSGSWAWSAAAIAVGVAIGLLLGHAVAVTIMAALARLGLAKSLRRGLPLSSGRAIAAAALVASAGAIALLVASGPVADPTPLVPALTVVPTGQRVIVIGIDGVDLRTLDSLVATGRTPTLARLLGGAVATLEAEPDRDPARVWTTIATGQPADRHGIRAIESREVAGLEGRLGPESSTWPVLTSITDLLRLTRPAIATGDERRIPAFWEVAARTGLRTAVVHWWATWPAPANLGAVISDRALLRLEHGGAADGEVAPSSLYEMLLASWPQRKARAADVAARALAPTGSPSIAATITRSAEIDAAVLDMAADPQIGPTDLLTLYLPGLDIAQHALFTTEETSGSSPSVLAERVASLERYYEFLDGAIGAMLPASADVTVILIAEPGRVTTAAPGRVAISGGAAGRGDAGSMAPTAVAATVLHALGVPVASDLASGPDLRLLDPAFTAAHPIRTVSTYGARTSTSRPRGGKPLDREMIERMRSLGYLR
ncbi:MAG TPA: alkaline phosphatase family protein [Vicinamibacterales bacterium]|nr:alkaline phosphatase family protein [Vicinamibacterales bacterium]